MLTTYSYDHEFLRYPLTHARTGTMNISVLTGRILLGDVVYSTKNSCVRIVDCIITIRWWMKTVRESAVVNGM